MRFRTFVVFVVVAAVAVIAATALLGREAVPSLTVTSPVGGEAWRPGETHTISWTTEGVPAGDRIAVTIRRIPPPPLPAEGQEFDPIIFTNLPDTGSTTWRISSMYPDGTYVLGVSVYASVPVTNPVSGESGTFTLTHPMPSSDAYPLYSGASWDAPVVETFVIGSTTYSGASVTSSSVTGTMDSGSVFTPFETYYAKKLRALGYTVDNELAAGGHTGGQTAYQKGSSLILTRFNIIYHTIPANAPSECPCDVTLSVFSRSR